MGTNPIFALVTMSRRCFVPMKATYSASLLWATIYLQACSENINTLSCNIVICQEIEQACQLWE